MVGFEPTPQQRITRGCDFEPLVYTLIFCQEGLNDFLESHAPDFKQFTALVPLDIIIIAYLMLFVKCFFKFFITF